MKLFNKREERKDKVIDYTLEDVVFENSKNPRHYMKPTERDIKNIKVGDEIRLIFILSETLEDAPRAERMWVTVKSIDGNKFRGTLENQPYYITTIKEGDEIEFFDRHIATVILEEVDVDFQKNALISKRALEKREINKICRVEEDELIDENDSGWELFYGDEIGNEEYCNNPENTLLITLDEVLDFEPLLEEPFCKKGKAYKFNEEKNVFEEVEEL